LISVYGLSPLAVVFWRALIAALALILFLAIRRRSELRLSRRDALFFLAFGLFGVAAFFFVYIYAIAWIGMGVAAVLMYTAPAWVTLLSVVLSGEQFDRLKGVALLLAVSGGILVGRVYDLAEVRLNPAGLLAGIGAGLTYAIYILFSKSAARRRYKTRPTLAYALGFGALFLLPLQTPAELARVVTSPPILFWLFGISLLPTLGGGLAFTAAMQRIPASDGSIIATLEPVVATLLGWAVFRERLDLIQLAGAALIIGAAVLLQLFATDGLRKPGPSRPDGSPSQS
jgi:drug/metabolite transporter (DMT)-like permease